VSSEILLKRNNTPTEAGVYLFREFPAAMVKIITIKLKENTLFAQDLIGTWTGGITTHEYKLCQFGDRYSVWSDRITILTQLACEVK